MTAARFSIGRFDATVVNDGPLAMGPARDNFPSVPPADVDALLTGLSLDPDAVQMDQNVLIVDTGSAVVQFDAGVGTDPEYGRAIFGPQTGRLIDELRLAGRDPAEIDVVAVTHTHPDHVWGLVDADGNILFPNASLAVSREDVEYWTNLDNAGPHDRTYFTGAIKSLTPYLDAGRIIWASDGAEIAPGITAVATPGHSPGHLIYRIADGDDELVVWGDLCHHVTVLQRPEWGFQYDHDVQAATDQRRRIYNRIEADGSDVLAYHFPFPGWGSIHREQRGFAWLPHPLPLTSTETSTP